MRKTKTQIERIRKEQANFEKKIYVCKKEHRELLERCKQVRTYTWIADTYIDTLFETENALDKLLVLREQEFINFEIDNGDLRNYIAYKSKIAKALERQVLC